MYAYAVHIKVHAPFALASAFATWRVMLRNGTEAMCECLGSGFCFFNARKVYSKTLVLSIPATYHGP